MNNLIPEFMSRLGGLLNKAYVQFDHFASNMNEAHYAIVAIIVVGIGAILMRGKPVHGS